MPSHSDSASPIKRPTAMTRTSSQQSVSRGSPGSATSKSKQHRTSLGRIHARTPSYGKNLHKLTKIVNGDIEPGLSSLSKKKIPSPASPNGQTLVRRNISASNLPKHTTKGPVRKNKSEVSLARNHSTTHLHRGKTTLPLRRNESHGKDMDKSKHHKHAMKLENEDDEGEWTEESVSPMMTRQSSLSRGSKQHSRVSSPPHVQEIMMQTDGSEDMSPSSPPDMPLELANLQQTARVQLLDRRQSRDAVHDPDVLASQYILSGKTLTGNNTPAGQQSQSHIAAAHGSTPFPENGVSRFLGTTQQQTPISQGPSFEGSNAATPILEGLDSLHNSLAIEKHLRPSASASNLPKKSLLIKEDARSNADLRSYTVAQSGGNRLGAATQNRLDLWRSQGNVETTDGPPAPMLKEAPMETLNNDEKRMRLWENAEKELDAVRRFVNPVLESAKRASARDKSLRHIGGGPHANGTAHTSHFNTPDTKSSTLNGERRRNPEGPRPPSRAGPRSVRFEIGVDNDIARDYEGVEPVDEILRRLWSTNESTTVEG